MYKGLKNVCIGILIVLLIFMYGGRTLTKMAFSEPMDIYEDVVTDEDLLKQGLAIDTELPLLMECFGSQTTNKTNGYDNSTLVGDAKYYYIMPIWVGEETYYVALETSSKNDNYDMLKKLSQSTMDWCYMESEEIDAAPVHITGGLVSLDDELYKYMKQWFEEAEWFEDEADIEKYVLQLSFREKNFVSQKITFFVELAIAVALFIAIIILSFKGKKAAASAKNMDSVDDNPVTNA